MENHLVAIAVGIMSAGFIAFYLLMKKYSTKEDLAKIKYIPIPMGLGWWGASDWQAFRRRWKKFIVVWFVVLFLAIGWSIISGKDRDNYVELDKILGNEDNYIGKLIYTSGDIVKAPGFAIYYSLVNQTMVDNNISPYQGLDLHTIDGINIEQFVEYDYPRERPTEYIERNNDIVNPVLLRGRLIDRGQITDAARYSFEVIEIQELNVIN
ncbi:hypothetical protein C4566_03515 [Candidatus Parcubacteria bacterium]|nr:MAG: hypothetical protein C4566_03515 [Candidatus Parcubacteria bacterium]